MPTFFLESLNNSLINVAPFTSRVSFDVQTVWWKIASPLLNEETMATTFQSWNTCGFAFVSWFGFNCAFVHYFTSKICWQQQPLCFVTVHINGSKRKTDLNHAWQKYFVLYAIFLLIFSIFGFWRRSQVDLNSTKHILCCCCNTTNWWVSVAFAQKHRHFACYSNIAKFAIRILEALWIVV